MAAAYRWLAGIEGVQELRCTSSVTGGNAAQKTQEQTVGNRGAGGCVDGNTSGA